MSKGYSTSTTRHFVPSSDKCGSKVSPEHVAHGYVHYTWGYATGASVTILNKTLQLSVQCMVYSI